jgi:hypothetical protein
MSHANQDLKNLLWAGPFNSPRLQTGEPSRKKISIAPSGQEGAAPVGLIKLNLISDPSLKPGAIDITFLGNGLNTCTISGQTDVRLE